MKAERKMGGRDTKPLLSFDIMSFWDTVTDSAGIWWIWTCRVFFVHTDERELISKRCFIRESWIINSATSRDLFFFFHSIYYVQHGQFVTVIINLINENERKRETEWERERARDGTWNKKPRPLKPYSDRISLRVTYIAYYNNTFM